MQDPLETLRAFKEDPSEMKHNLVPIPFSDMTSKSYVFEVTKRAQQDVISDKKNKDYIPMIGDLIFNKHAQNLLFENHNFLLKRDQVATVETVSGTSALRILLQFFKEFSPGIVYLPNVSWDNYLSVPKKVGLETKTYPFFDFQTKDFDFKNMCQTLEAANEKSIVLLTPSAYNIAGIEPSLEQWKQLASLFKSKRLFAVFDCVAQGIVSGGKLQKDNSSIHIFLDEGVQVAICQSLATCMGLYGEMIGALHVVCKSKDIKEKVLEQLKLTLRTMYSNPPCNGGWVATKILENQQYRNQWIKELAQVAKKNYNFRKSLYKIMKKAERKGTEYLIKSNSPFFFLDLSSKIEWKLTLTNKGDEIEVLRRKYHIYISKDRFISLENIRNEEDASFILQSISEVTSGILRNSSL